MNLAFGTAGIPQKFRFDSAIYAFRGITRRRIPMAQALERRLCFFTVENPGVARSFHLVIAKYVCYEVTIGIR